MLLTADNKPVDLLCAKLPSLDMSWKHFRGIEKPMPPPPCPTVARLNYSFRKAWVSSPIQQLHPRNLDAQTDAIFEAGGTFPKPIIFGTYSLTFFGGQGNSSYVHHCSIANLLSTKQPPPLPKNRSFPKEKRFVSLFIFLHWNVSITSKKAGDMNLHDHQQLDQTIRLSSLENKGPDARMGRSPVLCFPWPQMKINSPSSPECTRCKAKESKKNYFTSSDPHHDMLGEGCQVRGAATQFFFAISYKSSRAAHSAEEHLANNQGQNMSNMFKHVKTCQDTTWQTYQRNRNQTCQ